MVGWFIFSYSIFNPVFIFIYNTIPDTVITYRLIEIAFSSWSFRLISAITLFVTILPIYFYINAQSLFFPTLKDLILQDKIDYSSILKETDPKREKAAHDLLKQQ